MHKLSLKFKIWLGSGIMLMLTAAVTFTAIVNLKSVNQKAIYIVFEAQPTMVDALNIRAEMNESARIINSFIISQADSDRSAMLSTLDKLNNNVGEFIKRPNITGNNSLLSSAKSIQTSIQDYQKLLSRVEFLVDNPTENYPALELSVSKMSPLNKSILTALESALLSEMEEENTQQRKQLFANISELRHNWMNIITSNRAFLSNPSETRNNQTILYRDKHHKLLNTIQKNSDLFTFEQEEAIDSIISESKLHFSMLDEVYNLYTSKKWRNDQLLLKQKIQPLINNISNQLTNIVTKQQENTTSLSDEFLSRINNALTISFIILFSALIIGIAIAWSNVKQISDIVNEVSSSLASLSNGNFNISLNENRAGETGKIATLINQFSQQLHDMINNLIHSVDNLQSASTKMSSIVSETSDNIIKQHSETEMVATAVEEMTATALEVANSASTAATSAKHANDLASSGALISTEALGGINHLVSDLNNASSVIQNLRDESNNISVVLDVIRDISEQTNLLALNAAIEAARAGEQGRGFAVVADEVRTLASRTQESTDQIREKIEQLQSGASNAVNAMDSAIKEVNLNNDQVEKVTEALAEIAGEISKINNQLDQMAAASEEQSSTSEEISKNIVSISTLAEKTAHGTQHAKQAEDELSMVSERIQGVISRFKT